MASQGCMGWVSSFRDQIVVFTGRVLVDGVRMTQRECGGLVELRRGSWVDYPTSDVTMVVHGDLTGSRVQDPDRHYSEKLVFAAKERGRGRHVHVIDAAGFSDLLRGTPARCRRLRRSASGRVDVVSERDEELFGVPVALDRRQRSGGAASKQLAVNLEALDRATAAHERTVRLLDALLASKGIEAYRPSPHAPQFDLGWRRGRNLYVAEVKTLSATNEDQQIRLGLGQVLDYATQLTRRGNAVRPVLALEIRPTAERWDDLATVTRVILTYGPDFTALLK